MHTQFNSVDYIIFQEWWLACSISPITESVLFNVLITSQYRLICSIDWWEDIGIESKTWILLKGRVWIYFCKILDLLFLSCHFLVIKQIFKVSVAFFLCKIDLLVQLEMWIFPLIYCQKVNPYSHPSHHIKVGRI